MIGRARTIPIFCGSFATVARVTNTATQHADSATSPTTRDTCETGAGSMLTASCGHNSRVHAHNGNNVAQLVLFPEG